jgi:MFS family permease
VLLASVLSCFARNYQVTMAAMVIGPLHAGAGAYGTCSAAFAIGGFLGAAGAAAIGPPSVRRLFVVAGIAGGLQIAAGVTPNLPSFVAVLLPIAVGAVVIDTMVASTVQLASPGEARGRAAAIVGLAGLGGSTVGAVLLGFLADHFGARVPLVAGGIVVLVAVVLAMAMRSRDETAVEATAPAELVAIAA